jgi:hypothetical protein
MGWACAGFIRHANSVESFDQDALNSGVALRGAGCRGGTLSAPDDSDLQRLSCRAIGDLNPDVLGTVREG